MKSLPGIVRRPVVLAVVTIFIASFVAFASYAVSPPPAVTHTLQPTPGPPPPPTPANGKIAFLRQDSDYTLNGIYLINPDGSGEAKVPYTESDSTPVWSPNGLRLAVVHLASPHSGSVSGWGVEVMNVDGSGRVRFNDNVEPGERIAWSPDGTKIAYTRWSNFGPNADIMVMDANTGADIANLTNDPAYDYLPSWSPDGTKIAFTSNRSGNLDIFVMNADGSNPQNITNYFANDYYPAWSPDGSKIVFVSSGRGGTFNNDEICAMNADGSNVVNLTVNQVNDLMPAWSPDGAQIVFNSDRNGNRDLYSMNADGSNQTRVTVHIAEDSRASWQQTPIATPTPSPTPSPAVNGNIAFTRVGPPAERVATINEDGGNQTDLTAGSNAEDPEFSPDGTRIAFSSVSNGQFRIWVMNADGSGSTRLTNSGPRGDDEPTWSPDGSKIAFVGGGQILVINADGTNEINLSSGRTGDNDPDWSPDGSKIIFTKDWSSPNAQTFVMNADGSNVVNLSNTVGSGAERDPAWSPDGSKIAYQSFQDGHYEIYVMNADGSGETRLTNNGFSVANEHPDWSPDGLKIVFSSTRDNGEQEIYTMNADGTSQTRLTNDPVKDEHPSWGRYVAAPPTPTPTPTPTPQADLGATADAQPYQVEPGGILVFNSVATNYGPSPASHVKIDVFVPSGTTINNIDAPGGSCTTTTYPNGTGYQVLCSFGEVAVGVARSVAINVTITAIDGASMQAITTVSSSTSDPNSDNNTAYAPLIVRAPSADVSPGAAASPHYVATGGQVNYTVYLSNQGPAVASNVTLSSQFPTGVTLDSIDDDAGGSCAPASDGVNFICTFATLNVFESKILHVTATSNVAGASYSAVTTYFTANSTTLDSNPGNNTGSIEYLVASPPLQTPTPGAANEAELAYTKYDPNASQGDIFRRRADAAGLLNLTNDPGPYDNFYWSPDGSRIAFLREQGNVANLYVMNADGTNPIRLTNDSSERDSSVVWSPDGTRIAFIAFNNVTNTSGVHTVNVDGSNLRAITDGTDTSVAWSPNGARFLVTRSYYDFQSSRYSQGIFTIDLDGFNQFIFNNNADFIDSKPAWSPDGAQIAFLRAPNDGLHEPDLFLAQASGANLRNLTNDYSVSLVDEPRWSPGGSKLSFLSHNSNGPFDLNVINADGTGRTTLTRSIENIYSNKGWSPNGARLVFTVSYAEVLNGIYIVNSDGTGLTHIGNDIEANNNPSWSPDSAKLAFTSSRNAEGSIDIVNADGANRVDLTQFFASYGPPKWRPVPQGNTPAGTNVMITSNGAAVTFSNVTTAGQTTITPIDPNSLSGVPGEYVINANSLAFEIHTTAVYTGPITIGFQVPGVNNPIAFSALRVLHGEPPPVPNFVDRTVLAPDSPAPDFPTRTIYARVTSLSPFIVTERILDHTPPTITINAPANINYLLNQTLVANYSCMDSGSGVAQCAGPVASGSQVGTGAVGAQTFTVNARDNAGNTASLAVDYRITYGINPLFDQTKANKSGSTIPIKLELVNASGLNRSASNIVVTATAVTRLSNNAPGALQDPGNSSPDFNFRFTGGQYQFNLKTTGYATGTYRLDFQVSGDPVTHSVQFQVK
jgi:uncharacterized repeat protein (TIGR01451 family)